MKKLLTIAIAIAATFSMVSMASAAETYTVNMCGASAQAGFWEKAGASVVKDAFGCDDAVLDGIEVSDKEYYIIEATFCDVADDGTADDTVYVRYKAENSDYGCNNYSCEETANWPDPTSCQFDGSGFTCTNTETAKCQMGCADVPCETICASTSGFESGRSGYNDGSPTEPWTTYTGSCTAISEDAVLKKGVVVPFGFIANNKVTQDVCTYANLPSGAYDLAYDKQGWACESDTAQCYGNYECVDGACQDGNQVTNMEKSCSDASDCDMGDERVYSVDCIADGYCEADSSVSCSEDADCTAASAGDTCIVDVCDDGVYETACDCDYDCGTPDPSTVACETKPLKNVSRLMVLHIFSDSVHNWTDFGSSYPDLPIVKCMRHGGSGTHQTLIDTVFRGDDILATQTIGWGRDDYVWHYKSSSTLTKDCVAEYDGAIGYVDADKVMFRSGISGNGEGINQLMYQGVAPSRISVANGEYNFWAEQVCFYDPTISGCYDNDEDELIETIMTQAALSSYLTVANFNERAYFWATQGEMKVSKEGGDPANYPAR